MGISDFPLLPTQSLDAAYRSAIDRQALAPPWHILAMQILPDNNWSATVRKRPRLLFIDVVKVPSAATSEYLQIERSFNCHCTSMYNFNRLVCVAMYEFQF